MTRVQRHEILDYATYGERRPAERRALMAVQAERRVHLGEHLTFLFENHATVRGQIQEMVWIERIVKEADILHEIETYNELLGKPGELGCTLLIEIADVDERAAKLTAWRALPEHLYVELAGGRRVRATFDPRQVGDDRLSSVQFLKFDTGGETPIAIGSDLPSLTLRTTFAEATRRALAADLAAR